MRITGTALDDTLFGTNARDIIYGLVGNDTLVGGDGNDTIDGGTGSDIMLGGLGHDIFYVDNVGDFTIENIGEGTDWVYTTITYALPDHVEHMKALGTANINLFGNNSDNTLLGNRGNNTLNGGAGSDVLNGGAGNDTYVINQLDLDGINDGIGGGDHIIDNSGIDTVFADISGGGTDIFYIMQNKLENLQFNSIDTSATVHGNNGNNIIITGAGDDVLDGKRGADTLSGGDGANTYYVDHKRDLVVDTFGDFDVDGTTQLDSADTLIVQARQYTLAPGAMVENIIFSDLSTSFVGSNTRNVITGGAGRDTIRAGGGNDEINIGATDVIYGDAGADTFVFNSTENYAKRATIKDFNIAQGDVLNIADIIDFSSGDILARYVDIRDKGRDSILYVNETGDGDPRNFVAVALLSGITGITGEIDLVLNGNLIVE